MRIKNILAVSIVMCMVVFVGVILVVFSGARADEHEQKTIDISNASSTTAQENISSDNQENEDTASEIEHKEQEEVDIHHNFDTIQEVVNKDELPEVDSSKFSTYGDVIDALKGFQNTLSDIKNNANIQNQTASLSAGEQALLDNLLKSHTTNTDVVRSRIDELNSAIQALIDVLTPIAPQPISETFGLRKLLISEVKDFRGQIEKIKALANLEIEVIDTETQ